MASHGGGPQPAVDCHGLMVMMNVGLKLYLYVLMCKDMALVDDLSKILRQAGQEVPSFLSGGGGAPRHANKYGASDVRVRTHTNKPLQLRREMEITK